MPTSSRSPDTAPHVVLVGMMGSGKTTVGKMLAAHLSRPFLDSDEEIETRTGSMVREIFETQGEAVFRKLEAEALEHALESARPSVIAAAGGVVLDRDNRARLNATRAFVVWLHAPPEVLVSRAATGAHRPLLEDDPLGVLRRMEEDRTPLYEEVADAVVDVSTGNAREVAALVADLVTGTENA